MRVTLLLPPLKRFSGSSGTIARWVARGDRIAAAKPGREEALRACFKFIGNTLPVAALTHSLDAHEEVDVQWLRCDPAYVIADAVTLRLLACGDVALSQADAEQLAQPLKPLFGDAGFPLEVVRPHRWYLRCPRDAKLPRFSTPDDALGDDLARHLPDGDNARQWRRLLNEAQIILTQHPINALRMQRGMAPVNSVWLWGAGALPAWVKSDFDCVVSGDEIVTALAKRAGIDVESLPDDADAARCAAAVHDFAIDKASGVAAAEKRLLIDLAHRRDIAQLEDTWAAAIHSALGRKGFSELSLRFESGECVSVKPAHRWRIWRRIKPLA